MIIVNVDVTWTDEVFLSTRKKKKIKSGNCNEITRVEKKSVCA